MMDNNDNGNSGGGEILKRRKPNTGRKMVCIKNMHDASAVTSHQSIKNNNEDEEIRIRRLWDTMKRSALNISGRQYIIIIIIIIILIYSLLCAIYSEYNHLHEYSSISSTSSYNVGFLFGGPPSKITTVMEKNTTTATEIDDGDYYSIADVVDDDDDDDNENENDNDNDGDAASDLNIVISNNANIMGHDNDYTDTTTSSTEKKKKKRNLF
jgi:hypothetical protein